MRCLKLVTRVRNEDVFRVCVSKIVSPPDGGLLQFEARRSSRTILLLSLLLYVQSQRSKKPGHARLQQDSFFMDLFRFGCSILRRIVVGTVRLVLVRIFGCFGIPVVLFYVSEVESLT